MKFVICMTALMLLVGGTAEAVQKTNRGQCRMIHYAALSALVQVIGFEQIAAREE